MAPKVELTQGCKNLDKGKLYEPYPGLNKYVLLQYLATYAHLIVKGKVDIGVYNLSIYIYIKTSVLDTSHIQFLPFIYLPKLSAQK